jgi:hypothetical protein
MSLTREHHFGPRRVTTNVDRDHGAKASQMSARHRVRRVAAETRIGSRAWGLASRHPSDLPASFRIIDSL